MLFKAVQEGRFDPESAITYLNFQNDLEKGTFEVYSTWQYMHPLLPDTLNNKVWLKKLGDEQKNEANKKRREWNASSLEDIAVKATFVAKSNLPFIFTSVRQSIGNLGAELDKESALIQYNLFTQSMEEYKEKAKTNKG